MIAHTLTAHARQRMQQRGIRHDQVRLLLPLADLVVPVDRYLEAVRISRHEMADLRDDGWPPSQLEKLAGVVVVRSTLDGAVVTVAHLHGRRARHYRRRERRYWKQGGQR